MQPNSLTKLVSKQKGFALLMLAFVLTVAGLAGFMNYLNGTNVKIERDKQDAEILAQAKDAVIGYSIGVGTDRRPGDMLLPDSFASTENPKNYDGESDSGCLDKSNPEGPLINSDLNMRCLGRLPWKALGLNLQAPSEEDPLGRMPWYAVSGNLVDPTCLSILNSNILNLDFKGGANNSAPPNCSGVNLPYPWLTVRDGSGNVLSKRVAAIIFLPGLPHDGQTRLEPPNLGGVSQYLDRISVPENCLQPCIANTYSNSDADDDYILASENSPYAKNSHFNDKLIYITIDELMRLIEKRVGYEAKKALVLSPINHATSVDGQVLSCDENIKEGFLPLPVCTCTGSACDCVFPSTIKFTSDKSYSSKYGSCSFVSKVCTCTGAGGCLKTSKPIRRFVCNESGTCVSNISGKFDFSATVVGTLTADNGCQILGGGGVCSSAGNLNLISPTCSLMSTSVFSTWFFENGWKHNAYLFINRDLQIGARTIVRANP